jgi:hypothetical protein
LVLAAGVAQAEVTFSGKAEAGVSRTSKVDAVAAVRGYNAGDSVSNSTSDASGGVAWSATGDGVARTIVLTKATATGQASTNKYGDAPTAVDTRLVEQKIKNAEAAAAAHLALANADTTIAAYVAEYDDYIADLAEVARLKAILAEMTGTAAVAAVKEGDMVAYSGYDMEVAVSSTLDNGMVLSAGFDMGAGSIADRDDDRVLDAQAAAVALSTVTIKNGGVTYVIGNDEIDDLYDDTQNGDVSVSGSMGGISYTLVTDLDKDTKAVAASTVWTLNTDATTAVIEDLDTLVVTEAVAAVHESTSLKLSGAAAGVDWSFTTTNKDDFGDAASLITLGYAAGDALSFTLKHDTDGSAEAINTLSATYTMDAISLTLSAADDKDHARNTNTSKKASQNMTIAYANGPLTASFNNDESSQWWVTSAYDLGNGADIFATVDHTEFAVVGLSFNF